MPTKTIKIIDADGNPLKGAHVYPDNGEPTISNANGMATFSVADAQKDWVKITHVAGSEVMVPFNEIDDVVYLDANQLPPVIIKPKKKGSLSLLLTICAVVGLSAIKEYRNQPKKVKL